MSRRVKGLPTIVGIVFVVIGLVMTGIGIRHTISGEPIAGTRYSKPSTGPETLIFGIVGAGFGGFLLRKGLQGKGWPNAR